MDLSMATCNAERAAMKSSEYRKVIKPLLERRRRARINNCLDELKALILETAQPENTDASKLEKADILELTVQHLKNLRHGVLLTPIGGARRMSGGGVIKSSGDGGSSPPSSPARPDKFRAGFAECAHEVSAFISALSGVETEVKSRLVNHLAHCVNRIVPVPVMTSSPPPHHHHQDHHPYETMAAYSRIPQVTTPTPPPSPQQCGTPTTMASPHPTEYVVPVSPISPAEHSSYRNHHQQQQFNHHQQQQQQQTHQYHHQMDIHNNGQQYSSYNAVYPDVRSDSRSSSVHTPSSHSSSYEGYFSDRADSPVSPPSAAYSSQFTNKQFVINAVPTTLTIKTEEKPWRPW